MRPIDFFYRAARLFPHRPALVHGSECVDYATLAARVNAAACVLQQLDPQVGSRVALCAGNSAAHVTALLAILAAGKVWVPLNVRNAASELQRIVAHAAPSIVLTEAAYLHTFNAVKTVQVLLLDGEAASLTALSKAYQWQAPMRYAYLPDTLQAIKFTGGSTGVPKGVMQPARAWNATLVNQIQAFGFAAHDRYLIAAPLTHGTSTYLLPILAQGGCHVLPASNKPAELLRSLQEDGITTSFMPPTLLYMLMSETGEQPLHLPHLQHLIYGGAPMPVEKIRAAHACFGPVLETTYGQTEAPQVVSIMRAADFADEAYWSSVGRPGLLADVAIMSPQGQLLATGEVGEIVVRGDLVMTGYWQMPEATAQTVVNGWLHTGDLGCMNERGYLFIKGRLREVIITGGFNVYPLDVESVLQQHPAVHEAAVLGIADEKWGEAVHAAIQLKSAADRFGEVSKEHILAFAKKRLGSVKTPKAIHYYGDLPRSPAGKVHKPTLKADIQRKIKETSA